MTPSLRPDMGITWGYTMIFTSLGLFRGSSKGTDSRHLTFGDPVNFLSTLLETVFAAAPSLKLQAVFFAILRLPARWNGLSLNNGSIHYLYPLYPLVSPLNNG